MRGNGEFGEGDESDLRVLEGLEMDGGNWVPRGGDEEEIGGQTVVTAKEEVGKLEGGGEMGNSGPWDENELHSSS